MQNVAWGYECLPLITTPSVLISYYSTVPVCPYLILFQPVGKHHPSTVEIWSSSWSSRAPTGRCRCRVGTERRISVQTLSATCCLTSQFLQTRCKNRHGACRSAASGNLRNGWKLYLTRYVLIEPCKCEEVIPPGKMLHYPANSRN